MEIFNRISQEVMVKKGNKICLNSTTVSHITIIITFAAYNLVLAAIALLILAFRSENFNFS